MQHIVTGDYRDGSEFRFIRPPQRVAASTFTLIDGEEIIITRRATDLFERPESAWVIAHWHGEWSTDAFLLTVKELKQKAEEFLKKGIKQ